MQQKDYYDILGVSRDADTATIKKAYRKLARRYHPDVSKEKDADARMKEVNEAWHVLSDPASRAAYDRGGREGAGEGGFGMPPGWDGRFEFASDDGGGFESVFEHIFGGMGGRARPGGPQRGADLRVAVTLDLQDAYRGATRQLNLAVPRQAGPGRVVREPRTLEVRIPRGVRAGQLIRLGGQGEPGRFGGEAGDLLLEVRFREDARFRVDGADVHADLPLAPWECALGAQVPVRLPEGGEVRVKVPAGAQSGAVLRVRGKGIPGEPPGDLLLTVAVRVPPATSARTRELYETMAREFAFDARAAA